MYLVSVCTWNCPVGYQGSHNINASLHPKCEGKSCVIASLYFTFFPTLPDRFSGPPLMATKKCVDCRERLVVKEETASSR